MNWEPQYSCACSPSSSCLCSDGGKTKIGDLSGGFEEVFVPTIDCGDLRDLTLYRVGGFTQDWFDEKSNETFGRTVSRQRLGRTVEEMAEKGCSLITVQRLKE